MDPQGIKRHDEGEVELVMTDLRLLIKNRTLGLPIITLSSLSQFWATGMFGSNDLHVFLIER